MNGKNIIDFLKVAELTPEQAAKMLTLGSTQDSHGYHLHYLPENVRKYLQKVLGEGKKQ